MMKARRANKFDKISFLQPAPEIELEFLISKEEHVKCYKTNDSKLYVVRYVQQQRQVWTEYIDDGHARLEHISMKRVMQLLSPKDKKELIENWSALKGISPPKD